MAEDNDDSQKTEQPTQKRLSDAEEKGDVAQSPEIATLAVLAAATAFIAMWGGSTATQIRGLMTTFLAEPHRLNVSSGAMTELFSSLGFKMIAVLAVPLGMLAASSLAAHWVQHPPKFSNEKLKPDVGRLNPMKGFGRIFGRMPLINFAKGLVKVAAAGFAIYVIVWPARDDVIAVLTLPVSQILPFVQAVTIRFLCAALAVLAFFAAADYGWQYFERMKRLKMTRQELKEEFKQSEGDPTVKGRLKQIRAERARKRMMAAVPKAAVIITNPTHFAVALAYESGKMAAPVCVAKGVDLIALKIREIAAAHNVPIVENPPLARTLYASVDVDESIKPEHFKAVAQVIGYVMRLKNKLAPRRTEPRR
jgi:flagellar biosynthesis protein FlhB